MLVVDGGSRAVCVLSGITACTGRLHLRLHSMDLQECVQGMHLQHGIGDAGRTFHLLLLLQGLSLPVLSWCMLVAAVWRSSQHI